MKGEIETKLKQTFVFRIERWSFKVLSENLVNLVY